MSDLKELLPREKDIKCREYKQFMKRLITPEVIIKDGRKTTVIWEDGRRTMVHLSQDDHDNDYAAFTAALAKRLFGSNSALKRAIRRAETRKENKNEL